ncbi:uncharacterized protein [Centruroides vittatus]|uniref:uncharacterized protein n=1 Tax=Centruroides vittatus TaxID=120091 RepID=UPI00350ED42F
MTRPIFVTCDHRKFAGNKEVVKVLKTLENAEIRTKRFLKSFLKSSLPYLMRMYEEVNISSSCTRELTAFTKDLMNLKGWTFQMLDSTGKLPTGLLRGSPWFRGDYDQCLNINTIINGRSSTNNTVRGKFCATTIRLPTLKLETIDLISEYENNNLIQVMQNIFKPMKLSSVLKDSNGRSSKLQINVCIPGSCTEEDLENIGHRIFGKVFRVDFCKAKDDEVEFSVAQVICIGFLAFYKRDKSKSKEIMHYVKLLIKRLNRLTVPVITLTAINIILPLLVEGPHWQVLVESQIDTEKNWWKYITHVVNMYEMPLNQIGITWFTAALMQLIVISVIVQYIYERWPKVGFVIIIFLISGGIVSHIKDILSAKYYAIINRLEYE